MIWMIDRIMAFFGYVRIPLAAVQLCVFINHKLRQPGITLKDLEDILDGLNTLEEYLRSGRFLSARFE